MRRTTRIVASWFGAVAGIAGLEHGIFEILQGSMKPDTIMIVSIGPPCVPEETWNACEPAMTLIPNFLVTGILALLIGLIILIWSVFYVQRRFGGLAIVLLSVALLLFGGGLFPPLIGIVGGVSGTRINKPINQKESNRLFDFAAKIWPWPLVIFVVWVFGQWPVGHFFNEFMGKAMYFGLVLIFVTLPLSVYSAYAKDSTKWEQLRNI